MKNHLHDIDLIERFLEGRLSVTEANELNTRLREDLEFQKLYDRERLLINTIRWKAAQADLNFLKGLEQRSGGRARRILKPYSYYLAAAACIALIALIVWWPSINETPRDLFATHFKPYPNVFEPTLRDDQTHTRRTEAFQAYENGDYTRASTLFKELLNEENDPGMLMLLGNSNLMMERTMEAINNFTELRDKYDELDEEAAWYLALCHLKNGDLEQARVLFREASESGSPYASRARDILEELSR
jgi:tetratricopeptide (TPR) repeat protein